MPELPSLTIRLADAANRGGRELLLEPDAAGRAAVADVLGIPGVRKLRFAARLTPLGRQDWHLEGMLGATVVQECVATLAPVTSRIDERVVRTYLAELPPIDATEAEMPEDDTVEELPATLDLAAVMIEALALALPPYPRAEGARLGEAIFAAPGTAPLRDADLRPFAGLAGLRDAIGGSAATDGTQADDDGDDDRTDRDEKA